MNVCERCEQETVEDSLRTLSLEEEYEVCEGCILDIEERVENYYWHDRYTEEHHEKAIDELEKADEILCVHGGVWKAGEIIVHTNYVSADVVGDFCDHFGFEIEWFGPRWEEDETWDCVDEHGSCFEILLDQSSRWPGPLPIEAPFKRYDIEWLEDSDKQFDASL